MTDLKILTQVILVSIGISILFMFEPIINLITN